MRRAIESGRASLARGFSIPLEEWILIVGCVWLAAIVAGFGVARAAAAEWWRRRAA